MSPETAFLYAGDLRTEGTTCLHEFHLNDARPIDEAHRAQCITACNDLIRSATTRPFVSVGAAKRIERLCALREFFEDCPLYTKAPLAEAGPLALKALQNIRGFLDAQTLRLDDPRKDGSGEDSKVADCFYYTELAQTIMGESLSIVGPPAPIPAPAARRFHVTLIDTIHYEVDVEAKSEESAGEAAIKAWWDSQDPTHDFGGSGQGVEVLNVEPAGEGR